MLVCVLGPLRLHSDSGQAVEVSGVRLRRLLTLLAATAPGYVSATALAAAVWEDDTSQLPGDIANALQTLVSRARRLLRAPTMLEQRAGGYRLVDIETDISRFASLAKAGREALNVDDNAAASTHFEAALRLWRGEPFDDLGHIDSVAAMRSRLDEQHSEVLAGRISADIARGRAAEVIAELREQISRYPLREQFSALLMQALNQAGRPAEALEAYEQTRLHLSDELGADPGPHLREQHAAALNSWDLAVRERPRPHNLKAQVTTFLGRDQEVQQVTVMLESSRLTTVVGPGGAGKTRLATVVARQLSEQFADGVWFVELAPVTEAANLAQAVLQSLGEGGLALLEAPTEVRRLNSTERLLGTLAAAECLLLIDNCEHLIGPVASLVDAILARAPGVRVMATSREPLGVYGETLCMLAPLPVPEVGASVEEAGRFSAVALFVDRATAMQSSFRLDDRSAAAVIEIVRRLDGLPLAIELAAARLRVLPVDEVATRLVDRFRLLSGGSRSAMPRHRTLRAVVEWSWELLSPAERHLIERLSVFPAGATPEAAMRVCTDEYVPAEQLAALLDALVDKSLLRMQEDGGLRYTMLETIREYGAERLADSGGLRAARLAHGHHFAALVAEADQWVRTADQLPWLRLLSDERDNILAALRFLGETGNPDETLSMALSLAWYWMMLDAHHDSATWLGFALTVEGEKDPTLVLVARTLRALSSLATAFGDENMPEGAVADLESLGASVAQLHTDDPRSALLAPMMYFFGDRLERAGELLDETVKSPDPWVSAAAYTFRANLHENNGDVAAMRADTARALQLFSEVGERWGLATTLSHLAQLHTLDGELDLAAAEYERAAQYLAEFGAQSDVGFLHIRMADVQARRGRLDLAAAEVKLARGGDRAIGSGIRHRLADATDAVLAIIADDHPAMHRLLDQLTSSMDGVASGHPISGHIRAVCQSSAAALELRLGEPEAAAVRLQDAYSAALNTHDMPIVAGVAVITALLAATLDRPIEAAEILGAAAQLRGADDVTDCQVAALRARLVLLLGSDFEDHYQHGKGLDRLNVLKRVDPSMLSAAADSVGH